MAHDARANDGRADDDESRHGQAETQDEAARGERENPAKAAGAKTKGRGAADRSGRSQEQAASPEEHGTPRQRTHRVVNQGHSTVKARFVQPVVAKRGNVFLLCGRDGDIVGGTEQGLYFRDMRYLCNEELRVDGQPLQPLLVNASSGDVALFELSNPDLPKGEAGPAIRKETLGIRRELNLDIDYVETVTIRNHATEHAAFDVALSYGADFIDMFEVRGTPPEKRGKLYEPEMRSDDCLVFRYDGADGHRRTAELTFDPKPEHQIGGSVGWRVGIDNQQTWQLTVCTQLADVFPDDHSCTPTREDAPPDEALHAAHAGSLGRGTRFESSSQLFNQVLSRSLLDLHMLSMREEEQEFFAAGVPWYVALFGRDSLLTAMEMLAFDRGIAAHTLRVLAQHQATKIDDYHDAQPGKILHEFRVGEMANLGEVPATPYYGSVDSTPLFLALLAEHARWAGSLNVYHELRKHVDAALEWIDRYGDSDGDGLIDYKTKSSKGLRNQGWKDSFNSIVMDNGQLAKLPVALPEVQSWVYMAWRGIAELRRRDGDEQGAEQLEAKAADLQKRFEKTFWLDGEGYYGLCREAGGKVSKVIASNGAHALVGGIVPEERAQAISTRVLQPDMFSGWGVRTMTTEAVAYNPIDYQVGSIWPHDNAFIAHGMHAYGCAEEANRVFEGIYGAAILFEHYRLPEVFAGYDQSYSSMPVNYPVACNPQAWAAGSIPYLLQTALGLVPDAFGGRLRIVRPRLPSFLEWVKVTGLQVGGATADLRYQRQDGGTLVAVERTTGDLHVQIEY